MTRPPRFRRRIGPTSIARSDVRPSLPQGADPHHLHVIFDLETLLLEPGASLRRREDAAELTAFMAERRDIRWHYLSTRGVDVACELIHRHGLSTSLWGLHTPWQAVPPGARPQLLSHLLQGELAGLRHCVVLSDCPYELWMTASLDRPAVALGYAGRDPDGMAAAQPAYWAHGCGDLADWLRRREPAVLRRAVEYPAFAVSH